MLESSIFCVKTALTQLPLFCRTENSADVAWTLTCRLATDAGTSLVPRCSSAAQSCRGLCRWTKTADVRTGSVRIPFHSEATSWPYRRQHYMAWTPICRRLATDAGTLESSIFCVKTALTQLPLFCSVLQGTLSVDKDR